MRKYPHYLIICYLWLLVSSICGLSDFSIAQTTDSDTIQVRVYSKTNAERPIEKLTKQNFRVSIDKHPIEIVSVIEEKKPLAIMLIFVLGINGKCGFSSYSQLTAWVGMALRTNLESGDQVGVVVTNAQGEILLKFDALQDKWENVFGSEWKTGVPEIVSASEAQSIACRAIRRSSRSFCRLITSSLFAGLWEIYWM